MGRGLLTVSSSLFAHMLYMWTGEESLSGIEGGVHRNRVSEAWGPGGSSSCWPEVGRGTVMPVSVCVCDLQDVYRGERQTLLFQDSGTGLHSTPPTLTVSQT